MPSHKLSRLPSLPTIAVEILRVFADPDAPIQKVAELVRTIQKTNLRKTSLSKLVIQS